MCGRAYLEIKIVFSIPPHRPTPNLPPTGTSRRLTRCRSSGMTENPASAASIFCAGAKDIKVGFANINAMAGLAW